MRNPYFSLLYTSWLYAKEVRPLLYTSYLLLLFANITVALQPLIYGAFIDALQEDGFHAIRYAWIYIGVNFGAFIIYYLLHGPGRLMELKLAFLVSRNFMEAHFHRLTFCSVDWHKNNHSGSIINRLKKANVGLKDFVKSGFQHIKTIVQITIPTAAMIYFSPWLAFFAILVGVLVVYVIYKFDKPYIRSLEQINEHEHKLAAFKLDSITNIITVVSLGLQERLRKQMRDKHNDMYDAYRKNISLNELKWFFANTLIKVIYCVIVIGYVYEQFSSDEQFQIGGLVALIGFINQFNNAFFDIALQYNQIIQYHTEVESVKVIESENTLKQVALHALPQDPKWKYVEINNLNFKHFKQQDSCISKGEILSGNTLQSVYILRNLSIRFEAGKKIALIGASGSGKSTLLELLKGFYPPENDVVLMVDEQISDFKQFYNNVTLLPQKPELFENTLLYNITMGQLYESQEIQLACETAGLVEVIESLPDGLNSKISESGGNLSGGQRQRLALARGILAAKLSDILFLDEPTSNIDPKMEMHIYKSIFNIFPSKTIIVSLHALHLLPLFDHVYVLKEGQIVEVEKELLLTDTQLIDFY